MSKEVEILIVDDSEDNVDFITEILEEHGFRHRVANNGAEAMARLRESRPDLVLLDIMMPGKNGVFVFKDIKGNPEFAQIPIVFVSGASEATGVDMATGTEKPKDSFTDDHARGVGGQIHRKLNKLKPDGFVEKPVDPPVLIETIRRLLAQSQEYVGGGI